MGKVRQPLARERNQALVAMVTRKTRQLAAHKKICADCHHEQNWPRRACDTGWNLAKELRFAQNALDVSKGSDGGERENGQGTLW